MEKPTHAALFNRFGTQVSARVEVKGGVWAKFWVYPEPEWPIEVGHFKLWWADGERMFELPMREMYSNSGSCEIVLG